MIFMHSYKFNAMKRVVTFLLIIIMFPVIRSSAQNTNLEKLNNYKIGFFTKKLNFNQNESALTDKQLEEMGDKYVDCLVQESNLAVSFHRKLKGVLPPVKVILYYQAENQYKIQLLNELQTVKQQQRARPGRNF